MITLGLSYRLRLPIDIRKALREEADSRGWHLSFVIVEILKSWHAFRTAEKKSKALKK